MRAHEATWWFVVRSAGGQVPLDFEASLLKVQGSELLQDVHQHQLRRLGLDALPFNPDGVAGVPGDAPLSPDHGENIPLHVWRFRGVTLGGGSSEIQRQILAKAIFSGSAEIERPRAQERSDEQRMLVDAVERLLSELGLPRLVAPESDGGFGGGLADVVAVAETMGAHLALEPFLWSSVLATRQYLGATGFPARRERLEYLHAGTAS